MKAVDSLTIPAPKFSPGYLGGFVRLSLSKHRDQARTGSPVHMVETINVVQNNAALQELGQDPTLPTNAERMDMTPDKCAKSEDCPRACFFGNANRGKKTRIFGSFPSK